MSMQDNGHGRKAGPVPNLQSGFANRQGVGTAPGSEAWGGSALDTKKSEVFSMAQGPGRPLMGQPQPMFGGGSSVFAPMPTYTPVTRGNEPIPAAPEPAPSFNRSPRRRATRASSRGLRAATMRFPIMSRPIARRTFPTLRQLSLFLRPTSTVRRPATRA